MNILKLIFEAYWNQVLILLAIIGYFSKLFFDSRTKKSELRHSFFQDNKLKAIKEFMQAYSAVEFGFTEIVFYQFSEEIESIKYKNEIWPLIIKLSGYYSVLSLFVSGKDFAHFESLIANVFNAHRSCMEYFHYDANTSETHPHDIMPKTLSEIEGYLKNNSEVLKQIGEVSRKSFNS